MVILALETATRAGSMATLENGLARAETGDASRTHGERLPGNVVRWLGRHGRTLGDVDRFAVIVGPGSFTGLRVGIAAIQGFALAGGRLVVPVPTLDAMARGWLDSASSEATATVVACLDGQRGDVFFAAWTAEPRSDLDTARVRLAPAVGTPAALAQALGDLASDAPLIVLGDGARRYEAELRRGAPAMRIEDVPVPLAAVAARVAQRPDLAVSPHALRPIYLRRPDAVLARERAGADGPGEFHVRRASGTDDLGAVEALQRRAFTNAWGAEAIRWELEHTDVARLYVLERPDGEVVAYCACWMVFDELHINSLAVDEGWRRRGLARRLLKAVFREAVAAGARSATLEVRRSNMPAQALYEGLGFRVEGVRRDYYQQPREDALVLWHRRLAEQAN